MFRIIIVILALGAGVTAAWLAMGVSAAPTPEASAAVAAPARAPLHEVLVAGTDLAAGTTLEESHLRWQPSDAEVPPVFISKAQRPDAVTALKGLVVRRGFVAGEPIREDGLAEAGASFLSGLLPEGKRAVAVRVSAESAAGGFILPEDRVDVIHTVVRQDSDGTPQVTSRAILYNVRVLAVDQTAAQGADENAVVAKTATLEVEPDQVAVIAAAEATGAVSLALRSATEEDGPPVLATAQGNGSTAVRVFQGGRSTLVEVPASRDDGNRGQFEGS